MKAPKVAPWEAHNGEGEKGKSKSKSKSKSKGKAKCKGGAAGNDVDGSLHLSPRKYPGIAVDLPDISNWQLAAKQLKIEPFFSGAGAKPFSCLRATQMNMEPPIKKEVEGVMIPFRSVNDFFLAPECRD